MQAKKITFLTSVGAGLEYYDFVIYALLAGFISKHFFPLTDHYAALMATFGIFAVGYFVRPAGGVIFGMIGDRIGRKKVFLASILLMAVATFIMGIIPTYASLGLTATIIFSLLRIIQGISFGAELPGSLTFLTEHVGKSYRGTHCGFMVASIGLGVTIGSLVTYILSILLSKHAMAVWGWRIPFLLGGILAIIGYFIRRHTEETPYFTRATHRVKNALVTLFSQHFKQVLLGFGIIIFPACFVVFVLCMPTYLHDVFGFRLSDIYLVITLGYIWSTLLIPLFGWLSDYMGRNRLLFITTLLFVIFGFFLFAILHFRTFVSLLIFMLLYQTIVAAMAACYFAMLAENFPTQVRYTGVALCYNVAYAVAALIPLLVNYIYKITHNTTYISWLFVIVAAITMICALLIQSHTRKELT
jgi:MFS family permease